MNTELQIFNSSEFGSIRTLEIDGKPYFCGKDIAESLGYANARDAIIRHCRGVVKCDTPSASGIQTYSYISEGDIYRLIAHSKLPSAQRFEAWIFDEVLPSIRKHGLYAADELLNNPDLFIKTLEQLKAEREKNEHLRLQVAQNQQIISELSPKASYYDMILQNKSTVPISQIAKDYGMSGRVFNAMLHDLGVQYKQGNTWLLYSKYQNFGYTQSKTHAIDAERSVMHTYWTQKGRLFLYDLLKNQKNLLPVIERSDVA